MKNSGENFSDVLYHQGEENMSEIKRKEKYMANYCRSCGAALDDGVNFCPVCGTALNGSGNNNANTASTGIDGSDVLKTAAVIGGAAVGASALTGLARRLTHRRRPPYMGPPPMGEPGGRGGYGGPGGPGRMM